MKNRAKRYGPSRVRLDDDDREIDDGQCRCGFVEKLDRARTIEYRPAVSEKGAVAEPDLRARLRHFRVAVAAQPRPRSFEERFEQGRLAAAIGTDKCHGARRMQRSGSFDFGHSYFPF